LIDALLLYLQLIIIEAAFLSVFSAKEALA
jgi:hypothetical protein